MEKKVRTGMRLNHVVAKVQVVPTRESGYVAENGLECLFVDDINAFQSGAHRQLSRKRARRSLTDCSLFTDSIEKPLTLKVSFERPVFMKQLAVHCNPNVAVSLSHTLDELLEPDWPTRYYLSDEIGTKPISLTEEEPSAGTSWYLTFSENRQAENFILFGVLFQVEATFMRQEKKMEPSHDETDSSVQVHVIAILLVAMAFVLVAALRCFCKRSFLHMDKTRGEFELSQTTDHHQSQDQGAAGSPPAAAGSGRYSSIHDAVSNGTTTDADYELPDSPRAAIHRREDDLQSCKSRSKAVFQKAPAVSAEMFEQAWVQHDQVQVWGATLESCFTEEYFIGLLKPGHVHCLASGQVAGILKFYLYAQYSSGSSLSMAEVSLAMDTKRISCVFKDGSGDANSPAIDFIKASIRGLEAPPH